MEQAYIKEMAAGSYQAFTHLYNIYAPQLYAFSFSLSKSEAIAKDIVQETFLKLWENRKEIDSKRSFRSYIFSIARNQLLNELRLKVNQSVNIEEIGINRKEIVIDEDIEKKLTLIEFQKELEKAKQQLTPRQRELFELNKEKGLSITEITQRTSISEQSIRNQLSLAVKKLRKEMSRYYYFYSVFFL